MFDLLEKAPTTQSRKAHAGPEEVEGHRRLGLRGFQGGLKTARGVGDKAATACYQCHTSQKDRDFVFSSYRR
jgi:hypothetical protein